MSLSEKQRETVRASALFCGVSEDTLRAAEELSGSQILSYRSGEAIFSSGDAVRRLGILLRGGAKVYKSAGEGSVLMSVLRAGDIIGMAAVFLNGARAVTSVSAVGASEVFFISEDGMRQLMKLDFLLAENYIALLTERIHFLTGRIESIASPTAAEKLKSYLRATCENGVLALPHGYTKLAETLSISRASLYRVMDELVSRGEIERHGNEIRLLHADTGNQRAVDAVRL